MMKFKIPTIDLRTFDWEAIIIVLLAVVLTGALFAVEASIETRDKGECSKRGGRWVVIRQDDIISTTLMSDGKDISIPITTVTKVDVYGCTK